jgi:NAD(P) transhydrogenase subunit alpha
MIVGVPTEIFPGENCVALTPAATKKLVKLGLEVTIEAGAGVKAGFPDSEYSDAGAKLANSRSDVFGSADVLCQMKGPGANPETGASDLESLRDGQIVIAFHEPLLAHDTTKSLAQRGVCAVSMELVPRITRAQSMDALSSMATVAGYKGVLLAAKQLPRFFPMFMTAAGTVSPAKVLVLGAGVAGLQAIATAKRLGAVVSSYDVRPVVKEQVESLGAKFIELDIETEGAEDSGGYAKEQSEDFIARQQAAMAEVIAAQHVIITTAAIPGRPSPILVTETMVQGMEPGSVIVDLASERGGNCALTQPGETITAHGVTIMGPVNLPTTMAYHASQMYANNVITLLKEFLKDGELVIDMENDVIEGCVVCTSGEIVHPRVRELNGLAPIEKVEKIEKPAAESNEGGAS